MRVALLGASGYTGRLIARRLDAVGRAFTPCGRDERRLADAVAGMRSAGAPLVADATSKVDMQQLADAHDVLINAVGPFTGTSEAVVEACVARRCHYVDITAEQAFVEWIQATVTSRAVAAGVSVVPAAGFDFLPGDLLATIAAGAVDEVEEVHVAYFVPGTVGMLRRSSAGTRRTLASLVGAPMTAYVGGSRRTERLGEARRLAWFPKPVGPRHAAGAPGLEALTLPGRFPSMQVVRTYLAMPTWQAEAAQFLGSVGRLPSVRALLERVTADGRGGPTDEARNQTRWGCVAEAAGRDGVGRAWAYGHDIYGFTAASSVLVACKVLEGDRPAGVIGAADVDDPGRLLDALADGTDLRWSVVRPGA